MESNKREYFSSLWIFLTLAILTNVVTACKDSVQETRGENESAAKTQVVEVVTPSSNSFDAQILISGTAMPNKKVLVHAMENGLLKNIYKDIGDRVSRGNIIARLENPEITHLVTEAEVNLSLGMNRSDVLASELSAAKADWVAKDAHSNRLNSIYQKTPQLTPISEVEKSKGEAEVAHAIIQTFNAKIKAQEKEVEGLRQKLAFAKTRAGFLTIKAPFSGVITKRYVDAGAMIQNGIHNEDAQAIVEIQDINPIRLTIPVPQSEAGAIKMGMEVEVTFPELPGESYLAKISRSANALDDMSKTMQVEIDIDNPDGKIISGMYAKAQVGLSSRSDVKSLPIKAQVMYQDAPCVLTVKDGKVYRISLRKGLTSKDYFEVLNPEITEETMVVITGKNKVQPGDIVEPILKNKE